MKTSDISTFKRILENNKRTLIFGRHTQYGRIACLGLIRAYKDAKQPIIIISKDSYLIDAAIEQVNRQSYKNLKYSLLREVCWSGNPDLILTFNYHNRSLLLELEIAMLANQMLTDQGYKPLIIIDGLSDFYYSNDVDVDLRTFFDEVIRMNIVKDQPLIIASNSFCNVADVNGILEIAKIVISSADCMIALPGIFKNNEYIFGEGAAREINNILDRVKIKESGIKLKREINEIIEKDKPEINEALLFDFNNGLLNAI